ncbi:MAG: hypothetical protein Q9227_004202 [Pyrenula ochraceoflavens]
MSAISVESYDIDDESAYQKCYSAFRNAKTRNFCVGFNTDRAFCVTDFDASQIESLSSRIPLEGRPACRWFNFWGWNQDHQIAVNAIASKYDVSPRLIHLLCPRKSPDPSTSPKELRAESMGRQQGHGDEHSDDLEKADSDIQVCSPPTPQKRAPPRKRELTSFSDVAEDLWHFCSVDFGRRYLCLGFNGLFTTEEGLELGASNKPRATRIWSTLLLCDDGTVISVFESPDGLIPSSLEKIRKNQVNVFQHLSRAPGKPSAQNVLMQVSIRPLKDGASNSNSSGFDALEVASLLFYYLFDDWITTYGLIFGHEHPYQDRLESLRRKMMDSAEVADVETLHQIGQQLTVLRRVYESYEKIANRILQRQASLTGSKYEARYQQTPFMSRSSTSDSDFKNANLNEVDFSAATMRLHISAVGRFERLLDRIRLYALAEIEQCLAEKEQLVWMNFNLVTLKESAAIEKLTRTTILLAKATILFLPVSLMTAYFSTQFHEIDNLYSLKTYWLCFLVVAVSTIGLLFGFGLLSNKVRGRTVYKSLTEILLDKGRKRKEQEGSPVSPPFREQSLR